MMRFPKSSTLGHVAVVLACALACSTVQARNTTDSERTIVESRAFLSAHPDLLFRIRGFELLNQKAPEKAHDAFRKAALYGDKPSQAALAGMYWDGTGVARDRPLAYAWMDLAAERAYPDFIAMREKFWASMDEAERARALQQGAAVYARYGDEVAKPRLARELRRERRKVVGSRTGYAANAKVRLPNRLTGGADSSVEQPYIVIDGSQFYADKFWQPEVYHAWLDEQWKAPREGRVEVGPIKPVKSRIDPKGKKPAKP